MRANQKKNPIPESYQEYIVYNTKDKTFAAYDSTNVIFVDNFQVAYRFKSFEEADAIIADKIRESCSASLPYFPGDFSIIEVTFNCVQYQHNLQKYLFAIKDTETKKYKTPKGNWSIILRNAQFYFDKKDAKEAMGKNQKLTLVKVNRDFKEEGNT